MAEPDAGAAAPDFDLPRDGGGRIGLSQLRGRPFVLFFYPRDDTAGCTAESVDFTALSPEFATLGVPVVGISPDSVKSHDKVVRKHAIGVPLASDETLSTLQAYGVWKEKSMYGRTYMGVERTTFLVGADGRIVRVWNKVKVKGHAAEVLEAAKGL